MPLFSVRGRFANNHTFGVNPVDAETPHEALAKITGADEVKNFGSPVVMATVKSLAGKSKKIRISDTPQAERKLSGAAAGGTKQATPPASGGAKTATKKR